jgi:Domain of unknown function (DUF3859)
LPVAVRAAIVQSASSEVSYAGHDDMRWGVLLLGIALLAPPATAQNLTVTIVEHGIYTAETVRVEKLPNGFNSNVVDKICHVETTGAVPAKLGVQFGFRYRLEGGPEGAPVVLRRVTRFPAPVSPPDGPPAQAVSENNIGVRIGATSYLGYGFDHAWELVKGLWSLEIWYGQRRLAGQEFEIGEGEPPQARPRGDGDQCFELSVSLPGYIRTGGRK